MTAGWPVEAPETRLLESSEDVARLSAESEGWVFKPAYSRFASRTLIRPRARQLRRVRPVVALPWVAQRYVAGKEHCSYSVLVDGELRAHTCYHPRYRVGTGSGIYFEPTDPRPVRAFLAHFGRTTEYTGQVGFDFIESPHGVFHVLECNPRATSGVHLFDDQPVGLVTALEKVASGPCLQASAAPRMIALAMLLFAAPRLGWNARFWRDYGAAHDVIQRQGDAGVLPGQLLGLAEIAARAVARGTGLLKASTHDIEWDGQLLESVES
jgi:hypothetical protein